MPQAPTLTTENALMAARDVAAAIITAEGQVLSRTADLAELYTVVVDAEGSAKRAATLIADAGLPYADAGSLGRLMLWHELIVNIAHEGGVDYSQPPFSEAAVRPILRAPYFAEGAGQLAGIWLSQEWPTIKAYVKAVEGRFKVAAPPGKPREFNPRQVLGDIRSQLKGDRHRRDYIATMAGQLLVELGNPDAIAQVLADITDDPAALADIATKAEALRAQRVQREAAVVTALQPRNTKHRNTTEASR